MRGILAGRLNWNEATASVTIHDLTAGIRTGNGQRAIRKIPRAVALVSSETASMSRTVADETSLDVQLPISAAIAC